MPHPNLSGDLLGGQIEACHEIGVLAPIYYTVGWSSQDVEKSSRVVHADKGWRLCYCDTCRAGMDAEGVDVEDESVVEAYRARQIIAHTTELKELVESFHPDASVYFNGLTTQYVCQAYTSIDT